MRRILLRAINKNQILILFRVKNAYGESISFIVRELSKEFGIPLSTLKLNSRILKELNLIDFSNGSNFKAARVTELGKFVVSIIEDGEDKSFTLPLTKFRKVVGWT